MQSKNRILVDTYCLSSALTGIRTYCRELCVGLEESNPHKWEILFAPDWRRMDRSSFLRGRLSLTKKAINHTAYFFWKQIALPLIAIFRGVDVVICPDFVVPSWGGKARYYAVLHDVFFWERPGNYNSIWRRYYTASVLMGLNRKSSHIVATSSYTKKKIEAVLRPNRPIEVVYQCAAEIHQASPNEQLIKLKAGEFFLHVGYFDKRKNLGTLVEAFSLFKKKFRDDMKLVLAGSAGLSPDLDDFANVSKLIKQLELSDSVLMPGHVSMGQLHYLYSNALAYVIPSLDEGFGIPILEAWQFDVPVVAANSSALPEIGGEAVLLFEPTDSKDLANCLFQVLDPEIRAELISLARSRRSEFSRASFTRQMLAVIDHAD